MKLKTLLILFAGLFISAALIAQEDVMVIEGGPTAGGILETTINDDVDGDGNRNNPNRIYELKRGQFYIMHAAINVDNPDGTLTIRAEAGDGPKPVIVRVPLNEVAVGASVIKGSLTLQGLQYHLRQTDGAFAGGWGNWAVSVNDS